MTVPPPPRAERRASLITGGIAAVSLILTPFALVIGLFGPLAWVYVSIAAATITMITGIATIVLAARSMRQSSRWRFTPPPGWPMPPTTGWSPPPGWAPDPSWPAPPPEWDWWAET